MATFTFEEQRVIILFLHLRGMKPIEIHQQLSETCNDGIMDVKNMRFWVRQFTEGRTSCENKPKEPPPLGTHLAVTFLNFRSSCKMVSTDPTDMPALAAICPTVKLRSSITNWSTCAIMSSDQVVCGGGSFGLFSHDVRPSVNCRNHERIIFTSIMPSCHVLLNCWWISMGFMLRKWRNRIITRCSSNVKVAIFSI